MYLTILGTVYTEAIENKACMSITNVELGNKDIICEKLIAMFIAVDRAVDMKIINKLADNLNFRNNTRNENMVIKLNEALKDKEANEVIKKVVKPIKKKQDNQLSLF